MCKSKFSTIFILLPLSAISAYPGTIPGFGSITDFISKLDQAKESTQLAVHAQLLSQYVRQAQQLQQEIASAQALVMAGRTLSSHQWSNFVGDITAINNLVTAGQQFSFNLAQMDQQFKLQYPGYKTTGQPFSMQYAQWNQTTMGNIMQSLQRFGLSTQQVASNQLIMQQLKNANATAVGRMEAVQVGNDIAVENVNSLNRLHTMAANQFQAYAAYTGYQLQKDQARETAAANAFGYAPHTYNSNTY